jgi:hypothetical protein
MMRLKYIILFIILTLSNLSAEDVIDLGEISISGELRRPLMSTINTDRKFDVRVDETILVNYDELERKLTTIKLKKKKTLEEILEEENK